MIVKTAKVAILLWIFTVMPAHAQDLAKGIAMAEKGDLKGAEVILREALRLNPNPARAYYELGRIYEKRGDFIQAIAEYKAGIKKFKQR